MSSSNTGGARARFSKLPAGRARATTTGRAAGALQRAWRALNEGRYELAIEQCDAALAGGEREVAFEVSLVKAQALFDLDRFDESLDVLLAPAGSERAADSPYGPAGPLLRLCLIATVRLSRQQPDDAVLFGATLADWLQTHPPVWCEAWLLRRAASLCWNLGTWDFYAASLRLAHAILGRFSTTENASMRRDVVQTRLMGLIALRNVTPIGSPQEELVAEATRALISEGRLAVNVLDGWQKGLLGMGGPGAPPRIVMAMTLKAMALAELNDSDAARATLDDVIARYEADPSLSVQDALRAAREARERMM